MDEVGVRARVRILITTGALPCEPGKTWAGRGVGDTCVACGEPIAATDIEFEVDVRPGLSVRLHRRCHTIWKEECPPQTPLASHR